MSDEVIDKEKLSLDDRLKATLYQFLKLYERWSEDRQEAAKQAADMEEFLVLFKEEVHDFKKLVPQVRQYLATSIQDAASNVASVMSEEIGKKALSATERVVRELAHATGKAEATLDRYQTTLMRTQWKVIGVSALTTIVTCLLLVWLLIPKPTLTLPLTDTQISQIYEGKLTARIWPKLSKEEQEHWLKITNQIVHPGSSL